MADTTESNRQLITAAFEAWRDDGVPVGTLFDPELVWLTEGTCVMAREYTSAQDFLENQLVPFQKRFPPEAPLRPVAIRGVYADGETVVVLWDARGVATDGVPYENSYAWLLTLREGRIVRGIGFFDAYRFDDLWNRVTPRT